MQILHTEGIVLKVVDFGEYDQILTVFTPERGVVKWIVKKYQAKGRLLNKISPLSRAEFFYIETKGEIWKCREMTLLNPYLKLRENYAWLETAGRFLNWIVTSQMEQKPAPKLYSQFMIYLEKIPLLSNLPALELSFLIQILKHEGVINLDFCCSLCQKPLQKLHLMQGSYFCTSHAPFGSFTLNEEESEALLNISKSQKFSELQTISIPKTIVEKAFSLFQFF